MSEIFTKWTPKELAALKRATAKLRAQQTEPDLHEYPSFAMSGHRGITWDGNQQRYKVFIRTRHGRLYCGCARTIDEALQIQKHNAHRV